MWFTPASVPTVAGSQIPGQVLFYVVSTTIALGAAMLSWYAYESRFLALKRFFARRSVPSAADRGSPDALPRSNAGSLDETSS